MFSLRTKYSGDGHHQQDQCLEEEATKENIIVRSVEMFSKQK